MGRMQMSVFSGGTRDLQTAARRGALVLGAAGLLVAGPAAANEDDLPRSARDLSSAYGVLSVLGLSVVPSETASTLDISTGNSEANGFFGSQFGVGFTVSKSFPLYLEGFAGIGRYDPTYVFSNGVEATKLPLRWNNVAGTIGIGWDFNLTDELVLRPMANASLGYVTSDTAVIINYIERTYGVDLSFLDNRTLGAYGYGGSLMLDYENYKPEYEIDIELRYTHIRLEPMDKAGSNVIGHADAQTIGLWSRIRVPTGYTVFDRPLRSVAEFSASGLVGDQRVAIGSPYLFQFGGGIEFDLEALTWLPGQRVRIVGRYVTGRGVSGYSTGFAITF